MDREDTCHRTCFSLQLDGNTLDNFAELKNIEGLKEGSVIKVVEEPYTMREARIHVRHVRDLLKSVDPADAYNGVECSSLSFLNVVTNGDILEKKKSRADSVDCTPPDYIIPGSKDRPLLPLQPQAKEQKCAPCLKVETCFKRVMDSCKENYKTCTLDKLSVGEDVTLSYVDEMFYMLIFVGPHDVGVEPTPRPQEIARGPDVPPSGDLGGQAVLLDRLRQGFLRQPVDERQLQPKTCNSRALVPQSHRAPESAESFL